MEPVGQLSPQDWLCHPDTRAVIAALSADGATPRFAGGCVRDALLGEPVHDVDIAIDRPPAEVTRLLAAAGIRVVPTGIEHGTVTAVLPSRSFEITALRRDVETDGRHAVVAFTGDWAADAARRDLTINALYADPDGAVYDPCDGIADLGARRVRFVGDAARRIEEDALRILRFFRFFGRFGAPPADAAALSAIRKLSHRLDGLSAERVRAEMLGILAGPDPAGVVLLMRGEGVTRRVLPEPVDAGRLRLLAWLETRGIRAAGVAADPLRRLAALIATGDAAADAERVAALAEAWRLSHAERTRLLDMLRPVEEGTPTVEMPPATARRVLWRVGAEAYRDRVLLAWADYRARHGAAGPIPGARGTAAWETLLHLPETRPVPDFPVRGADLLERGFSPGPRLGEELRRLEAAWAGADFAPAREDLLALSAVARTARNDG
jgi:poly(A) polymerase